VRVNDVLWHEAASLAAVATNDRSFTTRNGDDDKVDVIFGKGRHGLRLPTGREYVKAQYRNGIGKFGNVKARQIRQLGSRPLGVKRVSNPMRASAVANKGFVEVELANGVCFELLLGFLVSRHFGQSADPVALKTAVQRGCGIMACKA
jgi:hypothetical protein